jgi:hypothetical protein
MSQAKMIMALVATLICAVLISVGTQHYLNLREAAAQNEVRGRTMQATSGIIADTNVAREQRVKVDVGVSDARAAYQTQLEQAKRNEPTLRDRDDRPVPDSLRELAHKRRLARERSGRTEQPGQREPSR